MFYFFREMSHQTSSDDEQKVETNSSSNKAEQKAAYFGLRAFQVLLRHNREVQLNDLLDATTGPFDRDDFKLFLEKNPELFSISRSRQSKVTLKSNIMVLVHFFKLSKVLNNLKFNEHNNFTNNLVSPNPELKVGAQSDRSVIFVDVMSVVLKFHLSIKLMNNYFLIPFVLPEGFQIGDIVLTDVTFFLSHHQAEHLKLNVFYEISKVSKAPELYLNQRVEYLASTPTHQTQNETGNKRDTRKNEKNKDIKETVLVHLLVSQDHVESLKSLYSKMSKPYKNEASFHHFQEELKSCKLFEINNGRRGSCNISLKEILGLEYLMSSTAKTNVRTLKKKKDFPSLLPSANPVIKQTDDKKTLMISNLKATIDGENSVFLRFSDKYAFQIKTNHLDQNLFQGLNQKIILKFNMKRIYRSGECLVEMDNEDKNGNVESYEQFMLNEELIEDFSANPFLSSPSKEIIDLPDSDDDEDKDSVSA